MARSLARPSSALTDTFFALLYSWSTLKVIKEPRLWNLERLGLESWDYHILAVWPAYWGSLSFWFFQYKMGSIRPTFQGISMMMLDTCSVNRAMNCIIYPWSPTFLAPETYFVEDTFFFSLWIAGWGVIWGWFTHIAFIAHVIYNLTLLLVWQVVPVQGQRLRTPDTQKVNQKCR